MTRSRSDDHDLRKQLGQQAWAEATERAKYYFDERKAELLIEHGLTLGRLARVPRQRRNNRTLQFREFILACLRDDELVTNDDFLDAVEMFLQNSTTTNRIELIILLRKNPQWLGDRLAEFMKFA